MSEAARSLLTIAVLWSAAVVAPGPNFVITTRTALLDSRAAGLRVALGIATGAAVWGAAGFFGVHALFVLAPFFYLGMKIAGSAYLVLMGVRYVRASFRSEPVVCERAAPRACGMALRIGLLTSLANPQSALSTASLFAATMPAQPPLALGLGAIAEMTAIALVWYALVACVLTLRPAALLFARVRHWIDRLAGLAFIGLGTRLALQR